nr:histone [Halomarina rubra]
MSVELPFAPVDAIIRRNAGDLRVSADAAEALARRIQTHGATLATAAADRATDDGRKTLMAEDFGRAASDGGTPRDTPREAADGADAPTEEPTLPIAPVDRIARLDIDDRYRVSREARVELATVLEAYAEDVAAAAAVLAHHADRRTVIAADVETYFDLDDYFPPG